MAQIPSLQEMLEAGVHFGHQTRRWNPRMKPYILTSRNGIYVINLEKTLEALQRAVEKILRVRSTGASVLFVGTKVTIQGAVRDEATRSGQPYVTTRWLGGMLTNYQTIRKSIKHLEDIERMENDGVLVDLTKKEASELMEEKDRLQDVFGGIRNLRNLPGLVFIADAKTEQIAIAEAKRLNIPTVAIVDTNTDPTLVDYPIPANDDAIKSVRLIAATIANAVITGGQPQPAPVVQIAPAVVAAAAPAVAGGGRLTVTAITASAVKELRDKTGVSMMACKKALEEVGGDLTTAIELLRKRGEAVAQKRSSHAATEGKILAGRQGDFVALVEVSAETDFTARNADFEGFAKGVLDTVLSAHPSDSDTLNSTTSKYLHGATVAQATTDIVGKIGENISVRRFKLFRVEEGTTVESYIHGPGKLAVVVTLRHTGAPSSEKIVALAKDLTLQIAATAPIALESSDISDDVLAKEREIAKEQAVNEGIPEAKHSFVIEGRVKKFLKDAALVHQEYVKDNKLTVAKVVEQVAKDAGVPGLKIESFVRWQLGEGA